MEEEIPSVLMSNSVAGSFHGGPHAAFGASMSDTTPVSVASRRGEPYDSVVQQHTMSSSTATSHHRMYPHSATRPPKIPAPPGRSSRVMSSSTATEPTSFQASLVGHSSVAASNDTMHDEVGTSALLHGSSSDLSASVATAVWAARSGTSSTHPFQSAMPPPATAPAAVKDPSVGVAKLSASWSNYRGGGGGVGMTAELNQNSFCSSNDVTTAMTTVTTTTGSTPSSPSRLGGGGGGQPQHSSALVLGGGGILHRGSSISYGSNNSDGNTSLLAQHFGVTTATPVADRRLCNATHQVDRMDAEVTEGSSGAFADDPPEPPTGAPPAGEYYTARRLGSSPTTAQGSGAFGSATFTQSSSEATSQPNRGVLSSRLPPGDDDRAEDRRSRPVKVVHEGPMVRDAPDMTLRTTCSEDSEQE